MSGFSFEELERLFAKAPANLTELWLAVSAGDNRREVRALFASQQREVARPDPGDGQAVLQHRLNIAEQQLRAANDEISGLQDQIADLEKSLKNARESRRTAEGELSLERQSVSRLEKDLHEARMLIGKPDVIAPTTSAVIRPGEGDDVAPVDDEQPSQPEPDDGDPAATPPVAAETGPPLSTRSSAEGLQVRVLPASEEIEGPNGKSIVVSPRAVLLVQELQLGAPVSIADLQRATGISSKKIREIASIYAMPFRSIGLQFRVDGDFMSLSAIEGLKK